MGTKTSAVVGGLGLVGAAASLLVGWLNPSSPWRFAVFGLAVVLFIAGMVVIALGFRKPPLPQPVSTPSPPPKEITGWRLRNVHGVHWIGGGFWGHGTAVDAEDSTDLHATDFKINSPESSLLNDMPTDPRPPGNRQARRAAERKKGRGHGKK
jgi:MFS family permease